MSTKKRKPPKPPKGFQAIGATSPSEARKEIKTRLENTRQILEGVNIESRVRVHQYPSGSVNGEILIVLPRGRSVNDALLDLEEAIGNEPMPGYWISTGSRFQIKDDGEKYRRYKGLYNIPVYPQRATSTNFSEILLINRMRISPKAEKTTRGKTANVYFRIHWNPDGERPPTK